MDIQALTALLKSNPILTTGGALGIGGAMFASLKQVPSTIGSFAKRQVMTSVLVPSGDAVFDYLKEWLNEQDFASKSRSLQASVLYERASNPDEPSRKYLGLVPAPGDHAFRYKGRFVWLNYQREKADQYGRRSEDITLNTFGRDSAPLLELLHEVEARFNRRTDTLLRVYIQNGDEWREFSRKKGRPINTVILPDAVKEGLVADLSEFKSGESRYIELGLPYRRGYLFFGPPGNGKSSIVEALAAHFEYNLYVLSLSALLMDDQRLMTLLSTVPNTGIVLIEDVDAVFDENRSKKEKGSSVTFSGLLNALDGVGSRPGQIVMMSTNHIERLDKALLRPGRSDYKCYIGDASYEQAKAMFERFFPKSEHAEDFACAVEATGPFSMAAIQGHLATASDADQALTSPILY